MVNEFLKPEYRRGVGGAEMFSIQRTWLLGILIGCMSGCATNAPAPEVTDDERNEAREGLHSCLRAAARKLDDNRSDASTIALGMRPLCTAEYVRDRDLYSRRMSPEGRLIYNRKVEEAFLQIATSVVLEERTKRR
jgi:hypothetical protein